MLPMILVSYIVGLGIEFAVAQHKGEEVNEGFRSSPVCSSRMIMLSTSRCGFSALAVAFSVVFGKEVFGGTGMNVFNPPPCWRVHSSSLPYTPKISGEQVWIRGFSRGGRMPTGSLALRRSGTSMTAFRPVPLR